MAATIEHGIVEENLAAAARASLAVATLVEERTGQIRQMSESIAEAARSVESARAYMETRRRVMHARAMLTCLLLGAIMAQLTFLVGRGQYLAWVRSVLWAVVGIAWIAWCVLIAMIHRSRNQS